ncbi:5-methyltetrahydrofolate S-homocysteine methyltransferase, partial [mine drainage metagenome]
LHHLRQQAEKPAERPDLCLADFIAPQNSGVPDWIGAFAVTAGLGIEPHLARFEAEHDDYSSILLKALRIASPKLSPSACISACAMSFGVTRRTKHWTTTR